MPKIADEYTPTTKQVRDIFLLGAIDADSGNLNVESPENLDRMMAFFDRWLAALKAEVAAKALEEFASSEKSVSAQIRAEMPDLFSGLARERSRAIELAAEYERASLRATARAAAIREAVAE